MASKRISAALLALVTGATTFSTAAASAAAAPVPRTCDGAAITHYGTAAAETLRGTARRDVVWAGAGNDVVLGLGGDDVLCGGDGVDVLDGGAGEDRADGGAGGDTVRGGPGNDVLRGRDGDDLLQGGDGADRLLGDAGTDRLDGGSGDDRLDGGAGRSRLVGGAGRDHVVSRPGDTVVGSGRGDTVSRAPAVPTSPRPDVPAPVTPPVVTPVVTPPVADPPVVTPPVADPPVVTPPVADPPVVLPPVADPVPTPMQPLPEQGTPAPVLDHHEVWGPSEMPLGRRTRLTVHRVLTDGSWLPLEDGTTVAWSVDDATRLKVHPTEGHVVALAEGAVRVTATVTASGAAPVTVTREWTVGPVAFDGITLDDAPETGVLEVGATTDVVARRVYSDGSTTPLLDGDALTWESEDPAVATVDAVTGKVTAVAKGSTLVTAELAGGPSYGRKAWRRIVVLGPEAATTGLAIADGASRHELHLDSQISTVGTRTQLADGTTGFLPPDEPGQVWTSSDPTVVLASPDNGMLWPRKAGTVVLTVVARGHSDTIEVTVSDAAAVSLEIDNGPFAFGEGAWSDRRLLLPYATYADGTRAQVDTSHLTITSSDESLFTVDGRDIVLAAGHDGTPKTATVSVTYGQVVGTAPVTYAPPRPSQDPWDF